MKNIKKIAVMLIIATLLFCLVACDLPGGDNNTPQVCSHKDVNGDGYCDKCLQPIPSAPCTAHVDVNHDGKCDVCGVRIEVSEDTITVDFFSINDLHGKFLDSDTQVGVDNLTTYFKQQREENENVVLLSAGDMWQGSMESNKTHGQIITEWMNELDFVSMTLGNHEFDWGDGVIKRNLELAEFPFLAINVYKRSTNTRADFCQASITLQFGDISIGIIGAIGDCYSSISATRVEDYYFVTGSALSNLIRTESVRLRNEGVDFVILVNHEDYSGYDTELSNGYIDLVFEGHSHQKYIKIDEYRVPHVQGGGENKGISHAKVTFDVSTQERVGCSENTVNDYEYARCDADPLVEQLVELYSYMIGDPNAVIGYNKYFRYSNELCDKVAELYYNLGLAEWGNTYDIVLGGGFLKARTPYNLDAGEVTYAMLMSIFPFDNTIQLCAVLGRDLRDKFFETDNSAYHIYYEQYGAQIRGEIVDNQTYYIVVDDYTSQYAPNNLTVVAEYYPDVFARDLLAEFIENGGYAK